MYAMETMQKNNVKGKEDTCMKKKGMERKMIRTLFRNHRCTKKQNENKGNNIAIQGG